MVPPIVFEAALGIDKRSFNRHVVPIIIYAVVGTLVATGLTAVVVHKGSEYFQCETIPYIEALTFGALISSIDPIAVLSVLSNMGMTDTDTIYVVIFGESLLNDGVAIVLFQTLVHFLDENMTVDSHALVAAAVHFLVVALGSLLVGVGSGLCCTVYYWMMHGCQTPLVEVLIFCCWALLPYYVCDGIEWSGIVAVVATGFVMDLTVVGQQRYDDPQEAAERQQSAASGMRPPTSPGRERRRRIVFSREGHLSAEAKTHIGFVAEVVATMMETAIFAYLGLFLFSSRYHWNFFHTAIAIGGCCLSRAIMIPTLSFVANWITRIQQVQARWRYNKLPQNTQEERTALHAQNIPSGVIVDKNMQLVLWFAGLRGAMSFALVENIPLYDATTGEGTRLKSELKAMTSACIIFTVFVLGGSTYYLMELLGLAPSNPNTHLSATAVEKEMEMIGTLSKHSRSENAENEDETQDDNGPTEKYHRDANNSTVFRQRISTDKESTD
jgi:NhaP-type Na+/H+ or K+/H+ antiporter